MDAIKTLIGYVTNNVIFYASNVPSLFLQLYFTLMCKNVFTSLCQLILFLCENDMLFSYSRDIE